MIEIEAKGAPQHERDGPRPGPRMNAVDVQAQWANDEALLRYDIAVLPIGALRVAEHIAVVDGVSRTSATPRLTDCGH